MKHPDSDVQAWIDRQLATAPPLPDDLVALLVRAFSEVAPAVERIAEDYRQG